MFLAVLFGLAGSLHRTAGLEAAKIQEGIPVEDPALPDRPVEPEPRAKTRNNFLNGRRVRFGRFAGRGGQV
jgi:hypothetical protein